MLFRKLKRSADLNLKKGIALVFVWFAENGCDRLIIGMLVDNVV
jgi:hypothetical protein